MQKTLRTKLTDSRILESFEILLTLDNKLVLHELVSVGKCLFVLLYYTYYYIYYIVITVNQGGQTVKIQIEYEQKKDNNKTSVGRFLVYVYISTISFPTPINISQIDIFNDELLIILKATCVYWIKHLTASQHCVYFAICNSQNIRRGY